MSSVTADTKERPTYAFDLRAGVAAPLHVRGCGGRGCAGCRDCDPDTWIEMRREAREED